MLRPGLSATLEETVSEDLTARHLGSGDVPVYATPALVALIERAAVAAVREALEEGRTTVGAQLHIDHTAPTPVGARVTAEARLDRVEGRKLWFAVEVADPAGAVARATHLRVVVDREAFLEDAAGRR